MQFTNDSGVIIKRLLPSFVECRQNVRMQLRSIADKMYADFVKGEKYYCEHVRGVKPIVRSNGNILYPNIFHSYFIPDIVREFILDNSVYQLDYSFKLQGITIQIRFSLFSKNELTKTQKYDKHVAFMCIWLHNCIQCTTSSSFKHLSIYIYPTKFKKKLPPPRGHEIGVENINTAFTTRCPTNSGEIIIYREEEWRKVFIHETFHCFCLDVAPHIEADIHTGLSDLFTVSSKFNMAEAYSETWARIINAAYASYISTKKGGDCLEEFSVYFYFSIEIERMFSLMQMNKILNFQNLNFDNLTNRNVSYREDPATNVFGYYILTGIMMNGYVDFILWCQNNNTNLFMFPHVSACNKSFVGLIKKCRDKESCVLVDKLIVGERDKFINTTTRMSSIEVFY